MKRYKNLIGALLITFLTLTGFSACSQAENPITQDDQSALIQDLKALVDEDESLQSFEPNYNEEEAMDVLTGDLGKQLYPVKVGQKMKRVDRNLDVVLEGDSALGTITKTFEGTLFIAASFDPFNRGDSNIVDTLVKKNFSTTVTRKIKFLKVANTGDNKQDWKISAISLPEGGTGSSNILIENLTVVMPNGNTYSIDSPIDYFLQRGVGLRRQIPTIFRGQAVNLQLTVRTTYADTGFVTLTYGARKTGFNRTKRKFVLISETFDGQYYTRVYAGRYRTHQFPGYFHAVINLMPKQVVFDDSTPVESLAWGVPYIVK